MTDTDNSPPDTWDLADQIQQGAVELGCVANMLFQKISAHNVGKPLSRQDHDDAAWLINHLFRLRNQMGDQAEAIMDLHNRT